MLLKNIPKELDDNPKEEEEEKKEKKEININDDEDDEEDDYKKIDIRKTKEDLVKIENLLVKSPEFQAKNEEEKRKILK